MWVRRMTPVCPKCSGKLKKSYSGSTYCSDCGMKVTIKELTDYDDTIVYDVIEDSSVRPINIITVKRSDKLEPASKS